MTSKKRGKRSASLTALKIGSRVRCTDDGVEGRITWSNSVSVKVQWDDGEQVTWRRDSLAGRPIEILQPADQDEPAVANPETADAGQVDSVAVPGEEQSPIRHAAEVDTAQPEQPAADTTTPASPQATQEAVCPLPQQAQEQAVPASPDATAPTPVSSQRRRITFAAPKEKKISALDAAARVLAETGQPMNCQEMIGVMAERGYWSSPGGKTPQATLYSAIIKEIAVKGANSRFRKADRGQFCRNDAV
ncbi:MAG TPA: HTH domain-containing protein [Gemmataceae bacterium]|nr:HTH domain-containing protein [Gemmataceae bacterium]